MVYNQHEIVLVAVADECESSTKNGEDVTQTLSLRRDLLGRSSWILWICYSLKNGILPLGQARIIHGWIHGG